MNFPLIPHSYSTKSSHVIDVEGMLWHREREEVISELSTASGCSQHGYCRGPGKSWWRHPDSGSGPGGWPRPDQDDTNQTPRNPETSAKTAQLIFFLSYDYFRQPVWNTENRIHLYSFVCISIDNAMVWLRVLIYQLNPIVSYCTLANHLRRTLQRLTHDKITTQLKLC